MKNFLIISIIMLFSSCDYVIVDKYETDKKIQELAEKAYFEGQKDFMENDIRIKKLNNSCYIWIKSPWNNKTEPIFKPNSICN